MIPARLPYGGMTEEEIETLVGKVSTRVLNHFYQEVGRSVLNKFLWMIGTITISILLWLAGTGRLKIFQ
jgi:hypothetical protein